MSILMDIYFDEIDYNSIDEKILNKMQREYQIANQIISNMYSLTTNMKTKNTRKDN